MHRMNSTFRRGATALRRVWVAKTILPILRHAFDHDAVGERETEGVTCFALSSYLESLAAFRGRHLQSLRLGCCLLPASEIVRAWTEQTRCVVGLEDRLVWDRCLLNRSWTSMS